ncbi:hypothetical protein EIP86_011599 [Pleurotus ostreatoroseus]|nr:hypothetical protein EIP86_011599 [Pleurotus ostreatoroseus]
MVFSLKYGFTAAVALFLSAASGVVALDSGNYTIVTTSDPKQIVGSDIPATFVTSTIENLDLFGNWPVVSLSVSSQTARATDMNRNAVQEWYRWSIHKLPDLPNNYTFMLNGRYSMMGANDVYIGQYVNALTTQVWVLEPASNGSDQYRWVD